MMRMKRLRIHLTLAVQMANCQAAQWKPNCSWSTLPKEWGMPTTVRSTSGRKYGWWGYCRSNISPVSRGRTVWNSFQVVPCTGRQRLEIIWQHSRTACDWKILIMLNGFISSAWKWFWRNVKGKFGRRGQREGKATSKWQLTWVSMPAKGHEVTCPSCQIQHSWFSFTRCRVVKI